MHGKRASNFLEHGSPSRRRTASMLAMAVLGVGAVGWGAVSALAERPASRSAEAIAARTTSVHENVRASEVINHKGNSVVNERGRGSGTFNCPVVVHVDISYATGTVDLSCATSSGTLNGGGKLSFFTAGSTATFTGVMTPTRGTGQYAHVKGRFHVEGSMVRKTFALSATMTGSLTY